jgi:hypothetical protein
MAKAMMLQKAYHTGQVPYDGAFIISTYFTGTGYYSIYEITAYKNVKDVFESSEGLTFKTDGNRTHILIEPPSYNEKAIEPVFRAQEHSIPYRFSECDIIAGKRLEKILIPKEPITLYSSFTILQAQGDNYSFLFYPSPDIYLAIKQFLYDAFYNDTGMRKDDCRKASEMSIEVIKKFTIWKS